MQLNLSSVTSQVIPMESLASCEKAKAVIEKSTQKEERKLFCLVK